MPKLPTGFEHGTLKGAVADKQLLSRYLPTQRFLQFLDEKALYFTRTIYWKNHDACEANLNPVIKRYFEERNDDFGIAQAEALIKYSFGCCFCKYKEGCDYDHMWKSYTPEKTDYGVMVIFKASNVFNAVKNKSDLISKNYISEVRYIGDIDIKKKKVTDLLHTKYIGNDGTSVSPMESLFIKRSNYRADFEVRIIMQQLYVLTELLDAFVQEENFYPITEPVINNLDAIRIATAVFEDSFSLSYRRLFTLSPFQLRKFRNILEQDSLSLFEKVLCKNTDIGKGINIPIDLNCVEKIIIHPKLKNKKEIFENITHAIEKAGLSERLQESKIYDESW